MNFNIKLVCFLSVGIILLSAWKSWAQTQTNDTIVEQAAATGPVQVDIGGHMSVQHFRRSDKVNLSGVGLGFNLKIGKYVSLSNHFALGVDDKSMFFRTNPGRELAVRLATSSEGCDSCSILGAITYEVMKYPLAAAFFLFSPETIHGHLPLNEKMNLNLFVTPFTNFFEEVSNLDYLVQKNVFEVGVGVQRFVFHNGERVGAYSFHIGWRRYYESSLHGFFAGIRFDAFN